MTALIIDSSGSEVYLALAHQGLITSTLILPDGRQMSKTFLPAIQTLLADQIPDYIAVGTGPGSFTGTRVGVLTGMTLAFAWNIPCYPFLSTLLPDFGLIASSTYQQFILKSPAPQIDLVYISKEP
jgi:tRNA threonylcarbamoyl adenosine modification protein YeaZ